MRTEAEAQAMERAREYFRTKSSEAPVPVLCERIAEAFRSVEDLMTPLPAAAGPRAGTKIGRAHV